MMRSAIFLLLIFGIAACTPFVTSTPPPSPQLVKVVYTPTMRPWGEVLHHCALEYPEISLITGETSTALEFSGEDVILWFGEPPQGVPGYAASLGTDEIVIIAGNEVALQELSTKQLRSLYTEPNPVYQVWSYNPGNDLRSIFDNTVLGESSASSFLLLAPDPAAMLEAVATDPMAVGYIPKSWLPDDVQEITIERKLREAFSHPVLALTNVDPGGNLKNYLVCLQQSNRP